MRIESVEKRVSSIGVLWDGYALTIAFELVDVFLGRKFDVSMLGKLFLVPYVDAANKRCYFEAVRSERADRNYVTPYVSNRKDSRSVSVACASILRALSIRDAAGKRYPVEVHLDESTGIRRLMINFRRALPNTRAKVTRPRRLNN